ncbi:hypothetical protein GE061_003497 [Apolygus lucorum]|uniref:CS domain-containing protein n=1 Tax=Apolygus lucorum TaxID=248454 RepID=A0A8S9X2B3_APOLU|nr:hypothetical protein GE061_003497 [Apolygus lucorum]
MAIVSLSWILIICLIPRTSRAINQYQVIQGKLDPKWSAYLKQLAGDYDETPPKPATSPHPLTEKKGWSLARFGESTFMAVIHRNTSTSPPYFSLAAGDACGGALVSTEKLITFCACLASWYAWMKSGAKGNVVPGSVKSAYDIIAETIHVTHGSIQFEPDFSRRLNTTGSPTPAARCPTNADDSNAKMADVIIVSFFPSIKGQVELMPWPPFPIEMDKKQQKVQTAIVITFGTMSWNHKTFYDEFGSEIHISKSTVKFFVDSTSYTQCAKKPNLWKTLPQELTEKVTCFNASKKFDLCGGLIGSPVLLGGGIHGLVMSNISCDLDTYDLLALSFDAPIRKFIEDTVGKELKKNHDVIDESDGKSRSVYYRDIEILKKSPRNLSITCLPTRSIFLIIMPLIVSDYTWNQTDSLVIVKVPLHNKQPKDVDLFTSSRYIKAHFPPFLFEAALSEEIIEEDSKCVLRGGHILFELVKRENMTWACLTKELTKQELIRLKEEIIAETHNKFEKLSNEKAIQKSQRQSKCVSKHLALEGKAKAEIQRKKETLKTNALTDFMEWKKTETDDKTALLPLWKKLQAKPSEILSDEEHLKDDNLIFDDESIKTKKQTQNINKTLKAPGKIGKPLPPNAPVRVYVNIKCDFTHRSFPTPMRESKYTEEEEWLSKQAEARRKTGFMIEDLRPEENNPEWLLEKGKSFHEVGNYLGAVSAFSHAIRTWDKIPELYAARAATQVKLGNWRRAIFDATECLELCRPHVEANADLRFSCHLHRGLGLIEVGKPKSALADFVEALELRPDDGRIDHLIDRAESLEAEQEASEAQDAMRRLITTEDDADKQATKYLSPADLAD